MTGCGAMVGAGQVRVSEQNADLLAPVVYGSPDPVLVGWRASERCLGHPDLLVRAWNILGCGAGSGSLRLGAVGWVRTVLDLIPDPLIADDIDLLLDVLDGPDIMDLLEDIDRAERAVGDLPWVEWAAALQAADGRVVAAAPAGVAVLSSPPGRLMVLDSERGAVLVEDDTGRLLEAQSLAVLADRDNTTVVGLPEGGQVVLEGPPPVPADGADVVWKLTRMPGPEAALLVLRRLRAVANECLRQDQLMVFTPAPAS